MTVTAEHIRAVRAWTDEPDAGASRWSDAELAAIIEKHLITDAQGVRPWEAGYTPTYDLRLAASDVWEAKAARFAADFDFSADGGEFARAQRFRHAQQMALSFRLRRSVEGRRAPSHG